MKKFTRYPLITASILACTVTLTRKSSTALGQATAPAVKAGLAGIDEKPLWLELANRGLDDLLDRAFILDNVPEEQKAKIHALTALNKLVETDIKTLTTRQRKEIVSQISGGLDIVTSNIKDPLRLSQLAGKVGAIGIASQASIVEYWGEDPTMQAELRPAAEVAVKLYDAALASATNRVNALSNQISNVNDPQLPRLYALQSQVTTLQYTRVSSTYFLCLALDKADPQRAQLADEAIKYLKDYDNAASQMQATIRMQIAKFMLVKGDYEGAITTFKSIYEAPQTVDPPPKPLDLNNARFFAALAELGAKNPDQSQKMLDATIAWQQTNFASDPDYAGAVDADEVLKARIAWLRADLATAPADKIKFNEQASVILTALMAKRPGLKPLILDQLVTRLPANADLTKLDTLLLQSVIQKARVEFLKEKGEAFDRAAIEKGIAACKEILRRKGKPGITPDIVENATITIPFYAQKLDEPKVAAAAFLDYAQTQQGNLQRASEALNEAMNIIIGQFHAPDLEKPDPEVSALYDRAIPLAINPPFNHTELAYSWARRLQRQLVAGGIKNDPRAAELSTQAIKYFKMVPANSPLSLNAKYYLVITLNTQLNNPKLSAEDRTAIMNEIQTSAADVEKQASNGLKTETDPKKIAALRQIESGTILLAADLAAGEQKNPKRALELLTGFEDKVKDMSKADELLDEAQQTRVQALMDDGQFDKATAALVDYVKAHPKTGNTLVQSLLYRLNKDIDAAQQRGDQKTVNQLLPDRAALTGFMVKWAQNNPDPKIKAQAFGFEVFDANSKRLAAELETDPAKRKSSLQATAKVYDSLLSQPQGKDDANIQFGSALVKYDLGDYKGSRDLIAPLLQQRKLGAALMPTNDKGEQTLVDNDIFWEARYKFVRSNVEIAKATNDQKMMKDIADDLQLIYDQYHQMTGGEKWGAQFEKLRQEINPSIQVGTAMPDTTTQPAGNVP